MYYVKYSLEMLYYNAPIAIYLKSLLVSLFILIVETCGIKMHF